MPDAFRAEVTVSCVVPTHGRDDMLSDAIASIAAQTLTPFELVVADDLGSPSTRATVLGWAGRVPFPVRYVDASGSGWSSAGASRNAGAQHVSGDLVAFLDDDDLWEPDFLEQLTGALGVDGDFAVGWTDAESVGPYRIARIVPGLRVQDVVARNPGFVGSNFLMRREAFNRIGGFDPSLTVSNDKDLLVRALLDGMRYAVVSKVVVRNRIHDGPQLTDKTERRVRGIESYIAKHDALLSEQDRRYLRSQILSIRRQTGPTRTARSRSTAALARDRARLQLVEAVRR